MTGPDSQQRLRAQVCTHRHVGTRSASRPFTKDTKGLPAATSSCGRERSPCISATLDSRHAGMLTEQGHAPLENAQPMTDNSQIDRQDSDLRGLGIR